jgi:hypothetical protein
MLGQLGEQAEGEVRRDDNGDSVVRWRAAGTRKKEGGVIGADMRGREVRRPPMATGVTTWAVRRLATCGGPRPMAGRACGSWSVHDSHVAPA